MNKPLASLLCAALILPAALFAQSGNWASYRATSWQYRTAANSVNYITSAAELAQFAWLINNGTTFADTETIISANLNLSAHYWTPAGKQFSGFSGTLTAMPSVRIDGLKILDTSIDYAGLFGYINDGGKVSSITLTNAIVSAGQHVGGIAGYNDSGTIANCIVYGSISSSCTYGFAYVGGIAGYNYCGTITDCKNYGAVSLSSYSSSSFAYVGGIAGYYCSYNQSSDTIANCVNYGDISSSPYASSPHSTYQSYIGGIVGNSEYGTIFNCINHGAVSASNSSPYPTYYVSAYVGGIAGYYKDLSYSRSGKIIDCVNHGIVSASLHTSLPSDYPYGNTNVDAYIGGVIGYNDSGTIYNCINFGAIFSASTPASNDPGSKNYSYSGGIAGYNYYGAITDCVNRGAVSSTSHATDAYAYAGGIAGANFGTISNCTNNSAVSSSSTSSSASYAYVYVGGIAGFNYFDDIIANCINSGVVSSYCHTAAPNLDNYAFIYAGGITGYNGGGTIKNCYWNPAAAQQNNVLGYSHYGTVLSCATFGAAPGTLSTSVLGKNSLLDALNEYVKANPIAQGMELSKWTLEQSSDGYPYPVVLQTHQAPPAQYAVTFDLGEHGTRAGGGALTQTIEHGGAATAPIVTANAGWVFTGWDTEAFAADVTAPLTVNAVYSKTTYTVTFNLGEHGTRTGGGAATQTIEHGGAATAPEVQANTGWVFTGWNTQAFASNVTAPLTVTALYCRATYVVSFIIGTNGTRTGGGATTQAIEHGGAATAPEVQANAGWVFTGWNTQAFASNVTAPLTVNALYSKATYTVTFNLGAHGTRTGGGAATQTIEHGGAATAPEVQANAGWVFSGWDTHAFAANVTAPLTVNAVYSESAMVSGNWADAANRATSWQYKTIANATNRINTAAELAQFAWLVNNGTTFANTVNIIAGNMNLAAHYWTPAGNNSKQFTGTLAAENGAMLDGMTIIDSTLYYAGLFGNIGSSGRVSSLTITNFTISARQFGGSIAGYNMGVINDCSSYGTVSSSSSSGAAVGGIAGYNSGTIINCANHANISTSGESTSTGGIAGYNSSGTIANCANHGSVSSLASYSYIGGITSDNSYGAGMIANCVSYGAVSYYEPSVYAGGIAGRNSVAIKNSYWNPATTGQNNIAGTGSGTVASCATFGAAPGTLSSAVLGTTSLLDALNAYIAANPMLNGIELSQWTIEKSADGYPHLYQTKQTSTPTTTTTQIPVPHAWLDAYGLAANGDYEAAARAPAANKKRSVWECYLIGLDPTDETAEFTTTIEIKNGQVVIGHDPDKGEERAYKIHGKETLGGAWMFPTNSESRFFKVEVRMPEKN